MPLFSGKKKEETEEDDDGRPPPPGDNMRAIVSVAFGYALAKTVVVTMKLVQLGVGDVLKWRSHL